MEVLIAKKAGFCFGVQRAVTIALDSAKQGEVYTLGPLIHNPPMVEEMRKKGVIPLENDTQLEGKTVIIPSHGIAPEVLSKVKRGAKDIIDASCPYVIKARREAVMLEEQGYELVIIGDKEHPEIKGILGSLKKLPLVIKDELQIPNKKFSRVGVTAQTTMDRSTFKHVVGEIALRAKETKVINTICTATSERQRSTLNLLNKVEVMLVVGGYNSANTGKLVHICREKGKPCYQVERAEEIKRDWFEGKRKVGITAGASTPEWIIKDIAEQLREK